MHFIKGHTVSVSSITDDANFDHLVKVVYASLCPPLQWISPKAHTLNYYKILHTSIVLAIGDTKNLEEILLIQSLRY